MRIGIRNGLLLDPLTNLFQPGAILIEDGVIREICTGDSLSAQAEAPDTKPVKWIEAEGMWVVPGLIDLHVHFREPGFEYKENIASGSRAAIRGGVTTVCCMPNTRPAIDRQEVVTFIDKQARKAKGAQVLSIGAVTVDQAGTTLADFEGMAALHTKSFSLTGKGICAISEDGNTVADPALMEAAMKQAKKLGLPLFSHAEPEADIVRRDLALAEKTGCRLHFCHISLRESVDLIRQAKKENPRITAETAPHYFTLDETMAGGDPNRKMNPPLRTKEDVAAILEGLQDGTIDIIATDHAPHHPREKALPFAEAPFGVIGLETSFPVSYTSLVKTGILTPLELLEKMSAVPARILGMDRGSLQKGKPADIAIFDIGDEYEIQAEGFWSKGKNSPFLGKRVFGRTAWTLIGGEVVYEGGKG